MHRKLYKKGIDNNQRQEERRRRLLQEQQAKRLEQQDEHRNLECVISKPTAEGQAKYKHQTIQERYGDHIALQLSEWLREKPEDLGDWMLVPCPKGQRCLVVSTRRQTHMYNKSGQFRMSFKSKFSGGGSVEDTIGNHAGGGYCILDCIYNPENDIFFILDILWFGKQSFLGCEAQFRFFWLHSKFEDAKYAEVISSSEKDENLKVFHLLSYCNLGNTVATARLLQSFPLWPENSPELDGFLFYHKEASYTCGPTPLVCWLFPFMVEEVLHMTVSNSYERPHDYSNPLLYMEHFDKELARKRQNRQIKKMDYINDTDSPNTSITSCVEVEHEMHEEQDEQQRERSLLSETEAMEEDVERNSIEHIMNAERLLELEGITEH